MFLFISESPVNVVQIEQKFDLSTVHMFINFDDPLTDYDGPF